MHKPLLLSLATATLLGTNLNAESMYERIHSMEMQIKQMQNEITTLKTEKSQVKNKEPIEKEIDNDEEEISIDEQLLDIQENLTELNKATNANHLKLGIDYRFSADNLQYKMANGDVIKNNALLINRLWINMNWKATDNLSFSGQLGYNKAFGARSGISAKESLYETFDWITNENAYDGIVRVRSAYFLYRNDTFMGTDVPWTFSVGRRPSTNGHLINLRDDDRASSPMGHSINVEFDGVSSKFSFEDLTGVDGIYIKLCAGRGLTNASPRFSSDPYETEDSDVNNIDLLGVIFVPYNDGQYGIATQYYYAHNLIDAHDPRDQQARFDTVGNLHSFTANFTMNGIGDEWNDYLEDTFFFVSGAISITDPKNRSRESANYEGEDPTGMLGSKKSEVGYSAWIGLQMPSVITEDGKWGVEYNKGSAYWRSITYAEDTNIGSKLAARGNAYEVYFTEPLIENILSLQIRYTYIDYKYSGSNGFFGNTTGTATLIQDNMDYASDIVDKAQDLRFYLRYRY